MIKFLFSILIIFFVNQNCFAQENYSDYALAQSLNNLKVTEHAPKNIYRLIKHSWRVQRHYVLEAQRILDLIWSDPAGRKMLLALREEDIPIILVPNDKKTVTVHETQISSTYAYGTLTPKPLTLYYTTVVIPIKHIDDFNNRNLNVHTRIYNLQAFVHEIGHAYMFTIDIGNKDSIEEEIGVSMLGFNIANKIITGRYLTREQSKQYAQGCLVSLLSDNHRNLPVYGYFNSKLMTQGLCLPYLEEYIDIPVMYKKLLDEGKILPAPVFIPYMHRRNN